MAFNGRGIDRQSRSAHGAFDVQNSNSASSQFSVFAQTSRVASNPQQRLHSQGAARNAPKKPVTLPPYSIFKAGDPNLRARWLKPSANVFSHFMLGHSRFMDQGVRQHITNRASFLRNLETNSPYFSAFFPTDTASLDGFSSLNEVTKTEFRNNRHLQDTHRIIAEQALALFGLRREGDRVLYPLEYEQSPPKWVLIANLNQLRKLFQIAKSLQLLGNVRLARSICLTVEHLANKHTEKTTVFNEVWNFTHLKNEIEQPFKAKKSVVVDPSPPPSAPLAQRLATTINNYFSTDDSDDLVKQLQELQTSNLSNDIKKELINSTDSQRKTLLMHAVDNEDTQIIRELIRVAEQLTVAEQIAFYSNVRADNQTALAMACTQSKHVIAFLLSNRISQFDTETQIRIYTKKDSQNKTMLRNAYEFGHKSIYQLLLQQITQITNTQDASMFDSVIKSLSSVFLLANANKDQSTIEEILLAISYAKSATLRQRFFQAAFINRKSISTLLVENKNLALIKRILHIYQYSLDEEKRAQLLETSFINDLISLPSLQNEDIPIIEAVVASIFDFNNKYLQYQLLKKINPLLTIAMHSNSNAFNAMLNAFERFDKNTQFNILHTVDRNQNNILMQALENRETAIASALLDKIENLGKLHQVMLINAQNMHGETALNLVNKTNDLRMKNRFSQITKTLAYLGQPQIRFLAKSTSENVNSHEQITLDRINSTDDTHDIVASICHDHNENKSKYRYENISFRVYGAANIDIARRSVLSVLQGYATENLNLLKYMQDRVQS